MKNPCILATAIFSIFFLFGCNNSKEQQNQASVSVASNPQPATPPPAPPAPPAPPIFFESGYKFEDAVRGDALLMKKLGTGVGKPIVIKMVFIRSYNSAEWEKGGKLHLMNDYSMGRQYRIKCSVDPDIGDKFMATRAMRPVSIEGIIQSYSTTDGLEINPCRADWD